MNFETIERQIEEIDNQIAALKRKKEEILLSDEEYSGYLDAYQAYYEDDPLTIREYYERMAELETIGQEFIKAGPDEIEECFKKHGKRMAELERMLAA